MLIPHLSILSGRFLQCDFLALLFPIEDASRTRDIVFCATSRAFVDRLSIMRKTLSGCAANSSRRARIGSIHLIRLSAIAVLHSMQPIPAVRQPSADHFSVSGGENSLCQSYTGQT